MSLIPKNLPPFPPIPPGLSPEVERYFREVGVYIETAGRTHDVNLGPDGIDPGHIHQWSQPYMFHAETHVAGGTDLISHDLLTNFVASEHINHAGVSIIAGTNLNGGGTIAANRTLNLDANPSVTSLTAGTLALVAGSITDSSGLIDFGNENLSTMGTFIADTLTLAAGSITDSSGAISFGNENLTTTGIGTFGTLVLGSGSITDSSGAISFGNEDLTTTGEIYTNGVYVGDILITDGSIVDLGGTITFGSTDLSTTGTLGIGAITTTGITSTGNVGVTGILGVTGTITATSHIKTDGNVQLKDPGAAFYLKLATSFQSISADRNLNFDVGDATRTLTFSGNPILGGQDYQTTGSPEFAGLTLTGDLVMGGNIVQNANVYVVDRVYQYGNLDTGIVWVGDSFYFVAGGLEMMRFLESDKDADEVIVNEGGVDIDFRVEAIGQTNALFVQGSDGNVGIGTTAPNAPLEVKGAKPGVVGGHQSGQLQVTGTGGEFYCAVITGHNSFNGNTQLWYLGNTSSSSHNDIAFINRQNAPIHFYTNNTSRMTIDAAGNVGIGTATPSEKLDVDGRIELTQQSGSTNDGTLWNDSTQEALQAFVSGIEQTLVGVIFTQTADQTIANTTTETTHFGTGVGTLTLPANFWTVGKTIRIEIHGDMADTGNPTAEVQAYYGATSLIDSGAITLAGLAGTEEWETEVVITCRSVGATGTVETIIDWEYETTTGSSAIERLDVAGALQTIDTTASGVLDVTFQWGTAAVANTLHSHVAFVEVLN